MSQEVSQQQIDMKYFQETFNKLVAQQNEYRDAMLESLLKGEFTEAEKVLREFNIIQAGLQLCQQTIMREHDRQSAEEARKMAADNTLKQASSIASVTPIRSAQPAVPTTPKKKGWFW